MRTVAIIPAAGAGRRMEAGINKQYLQLLGKPLLAHTLAVFEAAGCIDEVCLVVPEAEIGFCRESVVQAYGFRKVSRIVAGGSERQHSVLNALRALEAAEEDISLIHDGARPFVTPRLLQEVADAAAGADGAVAAVPVKDTVKKASDGVIAGTPPREELWLAQTPQGFRYGVIRAAHEHAAAEGHLGTDDSSLVERLGGRVLLVPGDYRNIKITTPEDMLVAEAFAGERKG
ncbi:MAG TPA: 2-C-methyl-D-erythritol 4-phosphate cytidylyltransferase [Verrucomicrobiae bacterium]|nr:2-C-methyl-D-erythritol 4-phosphate cytidylyltransferase [Verrucomicrobiae bacterium]